MTGLSAKFDKMNQMQKKTDGPECNPIAKRAKRIGWNILGRSSANSLGLYFDEEYGREGLFRPTMINSTGYELKASDVIDGYRGTVETVTGQHNDGGDSRSTVVTGTTSVYSADVISAAKTRSEYGGTNVGRVLTSNGPKILEWREPDQANYVVEEDEEF